MCPCVCVRFRVERSRGSKKTNSKTLIQHLIYLRVRRAPRTQVYNAHRLSLAPVACSHVRARSIARLLARSLVHARTSLRIAQHARESRRRRRARAHPTSGLCNCSVGSRRPTARGYCQRRGAQVTNAQVRDRAAAAAAAVAAPAGNQRRRRRRFRCDACADHETDCERASEQQVPARATMARQRESAA